MVRNAKKANGGRLRVPLARADYDASVMYEIKPERLLFVITFGG